MPPEVATVAVALHSGAERVMARCDRARRAGVEPGQMRAHAQALLDVEPCVVPYEPAKDLRVLERLANLLHKFSPRVMLKVPDGLLLDLTGMERIEPDERALLLRIRESFVALELHARLAVAPSAGAARALALSGTVAQSCTRCPDRGVPLPIFLIETTEMIQSAIESLPIASLDLDQSVLHALEEVRVRYVGQLL